MFLRRSRGEEQVTEGAVYRRTHFGQVVETVRVLSLSSDCAGIPHVRYAVHYEKGEVSDELRTLSLSSFAAIFSQRASA
jgi:hypothetical protein